MRINYLHRNSNILIISDYSKAINEYIDAGYFKRGKDGLLLSMDYPKAHIEFHTVNEGTGTEYDQVILLAGRSCYSFSENDELMKILDNVKRELIDNPDDRRLFYVGLTRTKNKLYIISPMSNILPFK